MGSLVNVPQELEDCKRNTVVVVSNLELKEEHPSGLRPRPVSSVHCPMLHVGTKLSVVTTMGVVELIVQQCGLQYQAVHFHWLA